jgi:hypothetical protein
MREAASIWREMSPGMRWGVIVVAGVAVVATGGVAAYALATGGLTVSTATLTVAVGPAAGAAAIEAGKALARG